MGAGASSQRAGLPRAVSNPPRRGNATLLVNGATRHAFASAVRPEVPNPHAGEVDWTALHKIKERQRKAEAAGDADARAMMREADPATLQILHLVREADALAAGKAALKLQRLRECYPFLEQVPPHRLDHLAVLVYQKEGDVYAAQGNTESAKTTYSRAIQIAETRVARGEREIYMVLKRYVLAMVGMARLWYEEERDTTGFTFADKRPNFGSASVEESRPSSALSRESSVLSDGSVFSLNQEILKSMAPHPPRRRVGPTVSVVKLMRPTMVRVNFTAEDEFVLRSGMTRELKASPCELLLLRCIEVVEIGHRRQSELLIPALIELAQIYEDLHLYNRSLLLVRRCLGILCNVYDYDHPWVIQLRRRADYLMEMMDRRRREELATKIQATWKMYKAMRQLEDTLGRPVVRHVLLPRPLQESVDPDFLKDFVSELPEGTVLYGADSQEDGLPHPLMEESYSNERSSSNTPALSHHSDSPTALERLPSSLRRRTRRLEPLDTNGGERAPMPPLATVRAEGEVVPLAEEGEWRPQMEVQYPEAHTDGEPAAYTTFMPNARVVGTAQDTHTDTKLQETEYGGVLTIRTTTVTRTITEREIASDEEDSDEEEYTEEKDDEAEEEEEERGETYHVIQTRQHTTAHPSLFLEQNGQPKQIAFTASSRPPTSNSPTAAVHRSGHTTNSDKSTMPPVRLVRKESNSNSSSGGNNNSNSHNGSNGNARLPRIVQGGGWDRTLHAESESLSKESSALSSAHQSDRRQIRVWKAQHETPEEL